MVDEEECGYCGAALPVAVAPKVVHVTKVEVKAPDVGRVFDSVGARLAGCGTGCVSTLSTLIITLVIAGVIAFNYWQTHRRISTPAPVPVPAPHVEKPAPPPHPPGRRHKRR